MYCPIAQNGEMVWKQYLLYIHGDLLDPAMVTHLAVEDSSIQRIYTSMAGYLAETNENLHRFLFVR